MREYHLNITCISMNISLFGCCLLFLINPLDSFQLSISNDPRPPLPCWPSKHLACPSHSWAARPLSREKWSLQDSFLTLIWNDLFDWSNVGLVMMSNLQIFFKSFSFYLFKSFSFYQMISNDYLDLNFISILSLVLIFQFEYQMCAKCTSKPMTLYPLFVMLLAHIKTKHRCLKHL